MNRQAIDTYIHLTDLSFDYGLINFNEYLFRQRALYELLDFDPNHSGKLTDSNFNQEEPKWDREDEQSLQQETNRLVESKELALITTRQGVICKWIFHMYDPDDKPSVPHGHGMDKPKLKLDPFRGNIFDINQGYYKVIKRESKKYIISLWNDSSFRNLATININYFIQNLNNYNYNWLGIRNINRPLKLPRKRK